MTWKCKPYFLAMTMHDQAFFESTDCERPFTQVAYKGVKTTINCHHGNVLCKQKENFCQRVQIQHDDPTWLLNPTNPDDGGFNVSISGITKEDAGLYWCERESQNELNSRAGVKLIDLKVKGTSCLVTDSVHLSFCLTFLSLGPQILQRWHDPQR